MVVSVPITVLPSSPTDSSLTQSIAAAIAALRQLTQCNLQDQWHILEGDRVDPSHNIRWWETAPIAALNDREHVAWAAGRTVLWLGQVLTVPPTLQGYPLTGLSLRLALTWWAEAAQIYVNGHLVQEGDLFDCSTRILLNAAVQPGEQYAIALRLVSPGHDRGALVRSRALYESQPDAIGPEPGFVADELAVLQTYLSRFYPDQLPILAEAVTQIAWEQVGDQVAFTRSLLALRQHLLPLATSLKHRQIQLVGHAHLDLAWLWPISDTWTAAERTFQSVLGLQQEFPALTFCHSTPALYDWIERHRPELFQQIQAQVAANRWEVIGGLWVEPELNVVSGESLVRQVLYGQQYTQQRFGQISRVAWLPDSFGFCWQLPQILKQGGIDYFVTQKLRWNDTTQFPYDWFWWQAPDGSRILSLMSAPIGEGIDPIKMATYASEWEHKTGLSEALWLPGVGDHGGGPTRDMLEVGQRWQQSAFFPTIHFTTVEAYLQQLEATSTSAASSPLPVWQDELYLEFHRGCYTTHADQKWLNRRGEELLYQAELFASLATLTTQATYPKAELETAWKHILFNQFHDILPGSSIPEVYEEANQLWQHAHHHGQRLLDEALTAIARHISLPPAPTSDHQALVVFNSLNWERSELVSWAPPHSGSWQVCNADGHPVPTQMSPSGEIQFIAKSIPAIGYRVFWYVSTPASLPTPAPTHWTLENEYLKITIDPATGDIERCFDRINQRDVLAGPGNQLQVFQDQGQYWDAWNIDPNYAQHPLPAPSLVALAWQEWGTLRSRVRATWQFRRSTITQDYTLEQGSPSLIIHTTIDWHERHVLLKAAFPLTVTANTVTCDMPCGAIQRPTRPQTAAEKAKWEIPALHWANLTDTDASYGVSLLNNGKHGYDSQPHQLRLTLLRGAAWPNPTSDLGIHTFTYALYPHADSWAAARTVHQGYQLNQPLQVRPYPQHSRAHGVLPPSAQLLHLNAPNLVLMALKQAESQPSDWIVRCYECHGEPAALMLQSDIPELRLGEPVNLLETPREADSSELVQATIQPWQIASFKLCH